MKKNKDNPKNIGLLVSNPWDTTALTPIFGFWNCDRFEWSILIFLITSFIGITWSW